MLRLPETTLDPDRYRWLPKQYIFKAQVWMKRWGYGVVAANRFLSGARSVISLTVVAPCTCPPFPQGVKKGAPDARLPSVRAARELRYPRSARQVNWTGLSPSVCCLQELAVRADHPVGAEKQ